MNLILAPIQGITFAHYRNLYHKIFGGIDTYYAPFIPTTNSSKIGKGAFDDILPENNDATLHIVPQLIGNSGPDFRRYAELISDMGYQTIDWNIGCPYRTVTKKKKGSGLLREPALIRAFMEEVSQDTYYDLTVKMRLGYSQLSEGLEVMKILNDYPIKAVTIHGRTADQLYNGQVNLKAFEALSQASKHDIIYNGDILSVEDYKRIQDHFPNIQDFMLARGALRDPFLPSEIKGQVYEANEKLSKIKALHDGVYAFYKSLLNNDQHITDKMKEFWYYTGHHLDPEKQYVNRIRKAHTLKDYDQAVVDFLSKI